MNYGVRWIGRVYGDNVLMMVRGGGDSDDDVSEGESYDEYDPSDDDIIDAEIISFASSDDDGNNTSIKQDDKNQPSDEEKLACGMRRQRVHVHYLIVGKGIFARQKDTF